MMTLPVRERKLATVPSVNELVEDLKQITTNVEHFREGGTVDVRLQVKEDGSWRTWVGLSDYDTDHHGFWGASTLTVGDVSEELRWIAGDLIEQAGEHFSQAEDVF